MREREREREREMAREIERQRERERKKRCVRCRRIFGRIPCRNFALWLRRKYLPLKLF